MLSSLADRIAKWRDVLVEKDVSRLLEMSHIFRMNEALMHSAFAFKRVLKQASNRILPLCVHLACSKKIIHKPQCESSTVEKIGIN